MKVLGLSGSLRADSHNSRLLRAAVELLPPGAELTVFDGLKAIPPYDQDDEPSGHQAVEYDQLRARRQQFDRRAQEPGVVGVGAQAAR